MVSNLPCYGYWEAYRRFQGDFFGWGDLGEGVTSEDLSIEKFVVGEENFHEGGAGFSSII